MIQCEGFKFTRVNLYRPPRTATRNVRFDVRQLPPLRVDHACDAVGAEEVAFAAVGELAVVVDRALRLVPFEVGLPHGRVVVALAGEEHERDLGCERGMGREEGGRGSRERV